MRWVGRSSSSAFSNSTHKERSSQGFRVAKYFLQHNLNIYISAYKKYMFFVLPETSGVLLGVSITFTIGWAEITPHTNLVKSQAKLHFIDDRRLCHAERI